MSKRIVICCDGTNNQFGATNTNVVRLIQALADAPDQQVVYYDPGIGTMPEIGAITKTKQRISETLDLMFATGLHNKVERAYSYLMDTYQPGDDVYLFGFSRGAYTVRVLAGLLHSLGLLQPRSQNLVPYAVRLFGAKPKDAAKFDAYTDICDNFRMTFARGGAELNERRFPIAFMGVWDTVSSVGWVWEPKAYPFTKANPSIRVARHAIAIDERRCFFRQNRLDAGVPGQNLEEVWFAGVHSDVGGGYDEADGGLWQAPFEWIVRSAAAAGLLIDDQRLAAILARTRLRTEPWNGALHSSLRGAWWIAEVFPKKHFDAKTKRSGLRLGLGRRRTVQDGAVLHVSVMQRLRGGSYAPENLSRPFVDGVRAAAEPAYDARYFRAGPGVAPPAGIDALSRS